VRGGRRVCAESGTGHHPEPAHGAGHGRPAHRARPA
jgi:hypothetical protein